MLRKVNFSIMIFLFSPGTLCAQSCCVFVSIFAPETIKELLPEVHVCLMEPFLGRKLAECCKVCIFVFHFFEYKVPFTQVFTKSDAIIWIQIIMYSW